MKTFLMILAALASAGAVVGQNPLPVPLTNSPQSLVITALSRNPELRYYEQEVEAARALRRTAGRLAPPEISGGVGRKRVQDVHGTLAGEGTAWSVGVSQSFEWPGRLGLRKAIANQDVVLAELGLKRFRSALSARVRGQAHGLIAAREKERVAREVADRYRALREVLVQRDPAGITPQLELRILEATEITLRRRVTEAELAAEEARLSLNHWLGNPVDAPCELPLAELRLPEAPRREELLAAALTNNFDLRLRETELLQQGLRIDLARNERWPAIKLGPEFSQESADSRERMLGLSLSLPLPLWRGNQSNIDAARARQAQAETLLFTTRRDLERRILSARVAYAARQGELLKWRPDSVKQFSEAAESADRHYRLGALPATTYVELQKQYLEAVDSLLESRREAVAAAAELEELTGLSLLPDSL